MNLELDTREYVSVLKDMVEQGMEVSMTVVGTSMEPFLVHNRDKIYFRKPVGTIKKGDMVFYQRESGAYVMHRVMKVRKQQYYMAGDHQTFLEGPIEKEQIFAKVVSVEKDGVWLTEQEKLWKFYAVWWRRLFRVRKVVNKLKRIIGK
jgi:hypothetical protein